MAKSTDLHQMLSNAVEIWGQRTVAEALSVERETVNRWLNRRGLDELHRPRNTTRYASSLQTLLPEKPSKKAKFKFIDLFAGIGGLRQAFESIGGECVFTSEWDHQAQRTYRANYHCDHPLIGDIREITDGTSIPDTIRNIDSRIPNHHVLLAGFPCQPFSIAGVSKKNALGRAHGFDCKIQGTLFFDVCKILKSKQPACFLLENVKNLKSHNNGDTYNTIINELKAMGYTVPEPQILDAKYYVPQHRERIVIVGFREDLEVSKLFDFNKVKKPRGKSEILLSQVLQSHNEVPEKYTLTPKLWDYLRNYKEKHRSKGNGFGYDLFTPHSTATRTLSARYYKDGSEILIARDVRHAQRCEAGQDQPRRLTPRECARLMGFDNPQTCDFRIPVSDTQAYRQFGNSVVVPVFKAVAQQMKKAIAASVVQDKARFSGPGKPIQEQFDIEFAAELQAVAQ